MQSDSLGYTLVELLLVVGLLALLVSLTTPSTTTTLARNDGSVVLNRLARSLSLARSTAASEGSLVTLCRSSDGVDCNGNWEQGWLIFVDGNGNGRLDDTDRLVHQELLSTQGTLRLRSFPNRQYLQFVPQGYTRKQNGSFTWCPRAGQPDDLAQQLIFSQSGRFRFARDRDGDGVREDAQGRPLVCSEVLDSPG